MKTFKSFMRESSKGDLNPKYQGIDPGTLKQKMKDRNTSPAEKKSIQAELNMRSHFREGFTSQEKKRTYDSHQKKLAPLAKERNAAKKAGKAWKLDHPKEKEYYRLKNAMGEATLHEAAMETWALDIGLMDVQDVLKAVKKKVKNAVVVKGEESVVYFQASKPLAMAAGREVDAISGYKGTESENVFSDEIKSGAALARNYWKNTYHGKYAKDNAFVKGTLPWLKEETGGAALAGAPGNNTRSGPGMGDDNTLLTRKMKKARAFKAIHRRHKTPGQK